MSKLVTVIIFSGSLLAGCAETADGDKSPGTNSNVVAEKNCVSLVTSMGTISLALDKVNAPISTSNFLSYVNEGFYNNTLFHRVIDGFVIQGGGFTTTLQAKQAKEPIINEADNGLSNLRGTIAMARYSDPQSATSEYFINTVDNTSLDYTSSTVSGWGYAVFGEVTAGMDVVDSISKVATDTSDWPLTRVIVQSATAVSCP